MTDQRTVEQWRCVSSPEAERGLPYITIDSVDCYIAGHFLTLLADKETKFNNSITGGP